MSYSIFLCGQGRQARLGAARAGHVENLMQQIWMLPRASQCWTTCSNQKQSGWWIRWAMHVDLVCLGPVFAGGFGDSFENTSATKCYKFIHMYM